MSVESAPPRYAQTVHRGLLLLGLLAALTSIAALTYIGYEYTTREELRNPPPQQEEHSSSGVLLTSYTPSTGATATSLDHHQQDGSILCPWDGSAPELTSSEEPTVH